MISTNVAVVVSLATFLAGVIMGLVIEMKVSEPFIEDLKKKNKVLKLKLEGERRNPPRVIESGSNAYKPVETLRIVFSSDFEEEDYFKPF